MPKLKAKTTLLKQLELSLTPDSHPTRLTPGRFDEAHECFERSSSQQRLIFDWLRSFATTWLNASQLRVLSVGCGSGILDHPFATFLRTISSNIEYVALDPNPVACRRFQTRFQQAPCDGVHFDVRQQTLESYQSTDSFDLILVVQSLYYVNDPPSALRRLLTMLRSQGRLVVMLGPKGALNRLAETVWKLQTSQSIWFSDCFEQHLNSAGSQFESYHLEGMLDVTRCFQIGSREGELVLDFVIQADSLSLGRRPLSLCRKFLKTIAQVSDGRCVVPHPVDVFALRPPGKE